MAPVVKQMISATWSKIGNTTWENGGFDVNGHTEWLYVDSGDWKSSSRPPEKCYMSLDYYNQIKGGTLNESSNYIQKSGNTYQVAWDDDPPEPPPPPPPPDAYAVVVDYD